VTFFPKIYHDFFSSGLVTRCLLKHVIEGKIKGRIEVTGRRGRRRKQLLADLKEKRGYCKLKDEALDRALWRIRFGRGCGPVVRHTTAKQFQRQYSKNCLKYVHHTFRSTFSFFL
jgi:hypothetical protein